MEKGYDCGGSASALPVAFLVTGILTGSDRILLHVQVNTRSARVPARQATVSRNCRGKGHDKTSPTLKHRIFSPSHSILFITTCLPLFSNAGNIS